MTFHQDILNGFQVTEQTALYSVLGIAKIQRRITKKKYISKSYNFCDLRVNISMMSHEDILNGFQVTELQSGRHCILFLAFFTNDLMSTR